jgi:5-formyltetrahydrofolate cyclo-ligase
MTSKLASKEQLRRDAADRRAATAKDNDIGARLLDNFERAIKPPNGAVVSGYFPIGDEANVMPLLHALAARRCDTALPVIAKRGQPLIFRKWRETDAMDTGPMSIPEPREEAPIVVPDLVLTPLLAFDRAGNRLGYGGGYYDRTIAVLRNVKPVIAVGIAYGAQEYPGVPHDDHDTPLDWIVTETEAIHVKRETR